MKFRGLILDRFGTVSIDMSLCKVHLQESFGPSDPVV
jgi:hypothetical protein